MLSNVFAWLIQMQALIQSDPQEANEALLVAGVAFEILGGKGDAPGRRQQPACAHVVEECARCYVFAQIYLAIDPIEQQTILFKREDIQRYFPSDAICNGWVRDIGQPDDGIQRVCRVNIFQGRAAQIFFPPDNGIAAIPGVAKNTGKDLRNKEIAWNEIEIKWLIQDHWSLMG